jgi:hypothetical protein
LAIIVGIVGGGARAQDLQVEFTQSVSLTQQEILKKDLRSLDTLELSSLNGEFGTFFKIDRNQNLNSGLTRWLAERAHYIVGENYELDARHLRVSRRTARYLNPSAIPEFIIPLKGLVSGTTAVNAVSAEETHAAAQGAVLMSNIGGLMFGIGKSKRAQLEANLEDLGWRPVSSSQFGVFKIGAKLFPVEDVGNGFVPSMHRLMTLFHEARHGDGNGRNMLFPHVRCPSGHDYEGLMACDVPSNGAYMVGATFLNSVKQACQSCSVKDLEVMKVILADHMNRVIGVNGFKWQWDETPEEIINENK